MLNLRVCETNRFEADCLFSRPVLVANAVAELNLNKGVIVVLKVKP